MLIIKIRLIHIIGRYNIQSVTGLFNNYRNICNGSLLNSLVTPYLCIYILRIAYRLQPTSRYVIYNISILNEIQLLLLF